MLSHFGIKSLTTSFTPEQRKRVDEVLQPIIHDAIAAIDAVQDEIQAMDNRPRKIYTEADPNVYFPYVGQAMLEDLIAYLQVRV